MKKWLGCTSLLLFFSYFNNIASAQEQKNEGALCARLNQANILSTAACSDPALRVTAFHYAQTYYALKVQNTPVENQLLEKQLTENNAALQHECALPPTGPTTTPPTEVEKTCFIKTRQEQIAVLSRIV